MANPTYITTSSRPYDDTDVIKYAHWFAACQFYEWMKPFLDTSFEKAWGSTSKAKKCFLAQNGAQWYPGERARKPLYLNHDVTSVLAPAGCYDVLMGNWYISDGSLPRIGHEIEGSSLIFKFKVPQEWDATKTIGFYSRWLMQNNQGMGLRWGDQISLVMIEQNYMVPQSLTNLPFNEQPSLMLFEWTLVNDLSTKLLDQPTGYTLYNLSAYDWFPISSEGFITIDGDAWASAHPSIKETQGGHIVRIIMQPRWGAAMLLSRRRYAKKSKPLKVSTAYLINLESPSAGMKTNFLIGNGANEEQTIENIRNSYRYIDENGDDLGYVLNMEVHQRINTYY